MTKFTTYIKRRKDKDDQSDTQDTRYTILQDTECITRYNRYITRGKIHAIRYTSCCQGKARKASRQHK